MRFPERLKSIFRYAPRGYFQVLEIRHRPKAIQRGIGDPGVVQIDVSQRSDACQVFDALVGDARQVESYRLQIGQFLEMPEAVVGNLRSVEIEHLEAL